ncbi:ARM repeat-containing protein, partial [Peniophora sp. CONT]
LDREVQRLLDALTTDNIELTVDELEKWAVKSIDEEDTRRLWRIAQLMVGKAANLEAKDADVHARTCQSLSLRLRAVQLNYRGKLDAGDTVFLKLLISSIKGSFDVVHGHCRCHTNESVAGARCRLALTRFLGEFFNKNILNEGFLRAFVERLLANVTDPQRGHAETVCELLIVVGQKLDTAERRTTMDGYIDRIRAMNLKLRENEHTSIRSALQVIQNLVELRERKWLPVDV